MVYNEADFLPVWTRHYGKQVGADYCFVIDHGSTEAIATPNGVNVLRLPRSAHDDSRRADFISHFTAGLLRYFDWVIYTDVDELLVADPGRYANLPSFCAAAQQDSLTCIGFDVQQVTPDEPSLNLALLIGGQRHWARFTSAMCKPLLTRVPLDWSPGFHTAVGLPPTFTDLYLYHLHWADFDLGRKRLVKTRDMPWSTAAAGLHQRITDEAWTTLFASMSCLPRRTDVSFDPQSAPLSDWLKKFQVRDRPGSMNGDVELHFDSPYLWRIPDRFSKTF